MSRAKKNQGRHLEYFIKMSNYILWRKIKVKSKEMLELIKDVEIKQHGITMLYPSRILWMQRTKKYDMLTAGVEYDSEFEIFITDLEKVLDTKVYKPTAKKILNNWYLWALDQRRALVRLSNKGFPDGSSCN